MARRVPRRTEWRDDVDDDVDEADVLVLVAVVVLAEVEAAPVDEAGSVVEEVGPPGVDVVPVGVEVESVVVDVVVVEPGVGVLGIVLCILRSLNIIVTTFPKKITLKQSILCSNCTEC